VPDRFTGGSGAAENALYAEAVDRGWFANRPDQIRQARVAAGAPLRSSVRR
jgi:hypothetical protein